MTAVAQTAPINWSGSMDAEGHRTYKATFLVDCDALDGPANVLQAENLPTFGSWWQIGNDSDLWAWALATKEARPKTPGERCVLWEVDVNFTTKPPDTKRCVDQEITNPLLIPPKISGDFVKYTEEETYDRFGNPIRTSSHEQIRGPKVEFDRNRGTIDIEMNFALLNLQLVQSMVDTVNAYPIWGVPARCVKLSKAPWERKFYGTCYIYYTYKFSFDVNVDGNGLSGFDRNLLDEGTKALMGHWGTSPGAGCTVTVSVDSSGRVINVTLGAAGSGYLPNYSVQLKLNGGDGNARVTAQTDSSGHVTSVLQTASGNNYTAGTVTTVPALAWLLEYINGQPPDAANPAHFCKFKDQHGENTKVVLNGQGLPAEQVVVLPVTGVQRQYVCIQNSGGNAPDVSPTFWLPLGHGPDTWDQDTQYEPGDIVTVFFTEDDPIVMYIATVTNISDEPPGSSWVAAGDTLTSRGVWNRQTAYVPGDLVRAYPQALQQRLTGAAGTIHVERYFESDFALLGIPLEF